MEKFNMWAPFKNEDYYFIDSTIREMFEIGGVGVYFHKYIGPISQGATGDPTTDGASYTSTTPSVTEIQDLFFLENRDRSYDPNIYEIHGMYPLQDISYTLGMFGQMLDGDTTYIEFHLNECLEKIGRKMLVGDVLEFPNLRDNALLDPNAPAVNKFYSVQEVTRSAGGYSPTWYPHIIRIKMIPLTNSQEFSEILNAPATDAYGDPLPGGQTLADIISNANALNTVSNAIEAEAEQNVPLRNFETIQFYVVPGDEIGSQYPWVFAGDGVPPNGAMLSGSGSSFPLNPNEGDWYLRIDMEPNKLYRFVDGLWQYREVDLRRKWQAAHRILETFINNKNTTTIQGVSFPEKQPLSKAILPRADF